MEKKEIVFISNFLGNGGAARVMSVLAESFYAQGYPVTVCSFPAGGVEYELSEGIRRVRFRYTTERPMAKRFQRISLIRREMKKHKGATVIAFEYFINMQTILALVGMKNRLIVSERNDPAREGGGFPNRIIRNFLYRFCDVLVCQTPDAKDYFPTYIRKHTSVIVNPIKDDLPDPTNSQRMPQVVNFCRLQSQKNIPLLIDAFSDFRKSHPEYTLTIYGDGAAENEIRQYMLSQQMEDCVTIHKGVPDVHQRILNAAMFVSSSDYEGLSNSMIEAMAIGLPTICTDCPVGGAHMMIRDGVNGLLTPVGDRKALADAMCRIAEDPGLAAQLSENGRKIRGELSSGAISRQWEALL